MQKMLMVVPFTTVTIVLDPTPTVTAVVNNQCTATEITLQFKLLLLELLHTYSIDGTNFKSGNTFQCCSGTYTVTKRQQWLYSTASPLIVYLH
jgi:hypothetical protein